MSNDIFKNFTWSVLPKTFGQGQVRVSVVLSNSQLFSLPVANSHIRDGACALTGAKSRPRGSGSLIENQRGEKGAEPNFFSDEILSTDEAAGYLRISAGELRNMTSSGQIPYYKLGARNRYVKSELFSFLLSKKKERKNGN